MMTDIPKLEDLLLPTVQALQLLDGSGTIDEIYEKVVQVLNLPDEVIAVPHGNTGRTEVEYRLAWSRTYLKKSDFLENSARGVWSLTPAGKNLNGLDPREIVRTVRSVEAKGKNGGSGVPKVPPVAEESEIGAIQWELR